METTTGGCLCSQLRVTAVGAPLRAGICHCLDCRKHHSAVFRAAAIFPQANVRVTGEASAYARRHFCRVCGGSVFARSGAEVELHLGALDAPNRFVPDYELWTDRREAWLPVFAGTTRHWRNRE